MAEHPNVVLLRKSYDAFAKGDMAALSQTFHENVVWHLPGQHLLAGDYNGRDAVFAAFARVGELSEGTQRIDVHDIVANDEHAVVLARETGSRHGKKLDAAVADIFHIKGGMVTEFWSFAEDWRLFDEFWSA